MPSSTFIEQRFRFETREVRAASRHPPCPDFHDERL